MLINDEEEKKKRLEEAMQITNNINSNNYQDNYSTNNINSDDEYTNKLQEAMDITNSINPIENNNINNLDTTESSNGNIDLNNRPVVKNNDGSISTVRSISFEEDGKEVLIPTVVNGKIVSDEEAIDHYHKTGEYLGKFNSVEEANAYAKQLHNEQEQLYTNNENNKKKVEIFKGSKAFEDGYQFGDITHTILGTATDITTNLGAGVGSVFENVVDIGAHAIATIQSLTGHEEASKKTRDWADKDAIKEGLKSDSYSSPIGAFYNFSKGNGTAWDNMYRQQLQKIEEKQNNGEELSSYEKSQLDLFSTLYSDTDNKQPANYEEESVLGDTSDQVAELLGYTGGLAMGTYLLGGAGNISVAVGNTTLNLPTLAVVGGAAGGLKEADSKGENVSEVERWSKAITGGLIEGTTEGLFGMLGVGGTELTDIWASKAANKMSTGAGKILAKLGVQATGEAAEEFLSYLGNYIVDNVWTNRLGDTDFSQKWDWREVGEQAALAFVSSAISLGGESYISTNQSIKTAEEQLGRELTPQEKTSVIKAITEDALIKYDNKELFEDGEESVGNYFVASYDENGEVGEVVETLGKAIENPNEELNIAPVIIKDQQSKTFNVIDGETGMLLDTTPYTSVQEAVDGFTEIVTNMSEAQIESVNNNVADSTLALYAEIGKMIQERQSQNITSQNQQNDTIEQNNIQGQEINSKNNKNAQNGFSNQIKTTMEQRTFENVSDKNIKSYQTENPEVSQEIQEMAYNFQEDLANSTFGERYKAGDEWTGTKRSTTKELAEIKDDTGASWGKIQKALEDISQGKGDYALAKKVELVLDKALSEGYKNIYGKNIMPNESYLTKKGKIEDKNYLQNEIETSTEIESNPEENRIFGERISKKGGNSNVRAEKINNNNSQQEISRNQKGKNTRGEKEISRSNGVSQEKLSKSVQQFQREQQKQLGKDTKISLTEQNKLTRTERTIQKEFENITGLNYGVYESNKGTEDAVYVNNDILVKHNSLQSKKKSNFLPFHELGHWFKVNRSTEWTAIHDIIDNTITKNQIEEYKNVLKDTSMFDNMSEAEIREYIIEEIQSDYFGNWANDISNWADMIRNKMLSDEYVQLLIDISDENISTHYDIFGTQEQQEQVYSQINEMMSNFIAENKSSNSSNNNDLINAIKNIKESKNVVNRNDIETIINNVEFYIKKGSVKIVDEKMEQRAGHNKNPNITKLNNIYPNITRKTLKTFLNNAFNKSMSLFRDSTVNIKDTNTNAQIKKSGLDENYNKNYDAKTDKVKANTADTLNKIIEEGIYGYTTIEENDKRRILYHNYFSVVNYDNKNELIRTIIKEYSTQKNLPNSFYYQKVESLDNLTKQIEDLVPPYPTNNSKDKVFEHKSSTNNSISQSNKNVKNSKNNTIKKSDRTLFDRNNQDLYYDYSEEVKGKNTSTYSNTKMRELIQANDIKQINNKKQFIRTVIEREGNSYWGNMFKDSTLRDAKYKNEIIKSYLEKQNENNIQNTITTDSEGRTLTKEQQDFYKGNEVVDENGNLQVVYHGTPFGQFTTFNDKNIYFFSVDKGFAEDYAYAKNFEQALDGDVEVMEVYLKAKNVFDPSKEVDIQKLREALPEQIRFFATTFDKETFLQRIQRIDDLPPMWTKEQIKNAKFGRVIGDDRYGYNNDIFIGVNKNNEVVYAKHTYGTALEHLTTKEQEEAKEKLLNGEDYVVTIYATPFGQMTEDAIREKYSQLENEQDKRYLADTIRYLDEGKSYMLDDSTYKISPYTASQEAEHLTDIDNWEYIEGSNAWENNEVGKDVIDIIKDLGYDGLKIYEKGKLNYAVFNKNQIKRVDNKKPTNNPDIRYSNRADIDSEGRELSREQQEYFRDSKVRDENGNLIVVFHGTNNKFNKFNSSVNWFTDSKKYSEYYGREQNKIQKALNIEPKKSKYTYQAYLNIKNPKILGNIDGYLQEYNRSKEQFGFDVKHFLKESNIPYNDFKNIVDTYNTGKNEYEQAYRIYDITNSKEFRDYLISKGYDGMIANEKGNTSYAVFNSNQIKNINNKKPTNNPDIRYSNRYDTEENGEGGFYSQLEKVIEEKMPNTSNAQQIKGIIENSGIKQDEIKWIGLDDYLKKHSLEKISKQQLQDYIKANQINIETVRKGTNKLDEYTEPVKQDIASKNIDIQYILDKYGFDYERDDLIPYKRNGLRAGTVGDFMAENLEKYIDLNDFDKYEKQEDGSYIRTYKDSDGIQWTTQFTKNDFKEDMQKLEDLYDQRTEAEIELSSLEDEYGDYADELGVPKYKQYSLEGGTNYQEILYTVPAIEKLNSSKYEVKNLAVANVSEYQSPHWQEKNVLAHARTQDFEDTSGNKVLFIDEIQSDLHQQGRNEGYETKEITEKRKELRNEREKIKENEINYENELRELRNKGYNNAKELYIKKQNKAMKQSSLLEEKYNIQNNLTEEQQYELLDYANNIAAYFSSQVRESGIFKDNIDNNKYMIDQVKEAEKNLNIKLSKDILSKQKNRDIYRRHAIEQFRIGYYDYMNVRHSNMYLGNNDQYLSEAEQSRIYELDKLMKENEDKGISINLELDKLKPKISDVFPFKKNWHEFVLRRMINNAVEQGYDEVAWTTGRQQRERYNLSKVIDEIRYIKNYANNDAEENNKPFEIEIEARKTNIDDFDTDEVVFTRAIAPDELENYIGKDLATKIINSKENEGTISNLDEEIRENGNSGMYLFYDQEIPSYLNKYLKKWNSKVEEITLMDADGKTESKQMGFKITDEMRNSIKQNGQPLFSNRQLDEEEASTYDERIQRKNRELIKELREQKESIQGLEGYSRTEIKDIVSNYIQDKLVENNLEDISINGAEIIGSRNRGNAKTNSDLDLVVEYSGDIREDDLFNILNEEPLEIEGIKVDINPITADNTGTLEEYLERSRQYDREVLNATSKETIRKEDPNVEPGATNAQGADRFIEQEIRKIETSGNWDNSIPVTKLTDIRETIEDFLGLGIKKGHFRERAYGIYKQGRDVIRGKELKDIDNILHETGHALDLGNRLKIDKESIANELLTAIQKHGGYENETRSTKLDEGFAEVIRTYSIIPEQAKTDYPQSVAVLEEIRKADKSFDDFIRKVQQQTYNYIHQNPQNRVHSNISVGESNRTPLTKAWLEQEVMRNVWDKDYAVKKVVSEIAKIGGKTTNQIKASNNAYYLTRLATGIHDKVTSMLSDGYINEKGEKIMPGLNKVGEILGDDAQRYNDLRDYLVARRDTDYKAKTLKTGIRDMDTKYVLEKFANDTQIKDAAQVVYDTLDGVMQYAVDNGLISEDDVKSLKESNAFYVPMQRVIEGKGNQLGRKGAVSDIIKARTGSELDIKDVLENIVSNSTNIIQQVENNNVLRALYNQGEEAGLTGSIYDVIPAPMMKVGTANLSMWENELKKQGVNTTELDLEKTVDLFAPNNKIDTKNLITSFINEDGKRVYLQFNDEILFNSLMNLDGKMMSNVLKINSKLNMPLRYGATMANIGFAIPNMISDTAQAAIFSNAGFIPVVDNALGVLDILTATNKHVKSFVKNYSPEYVNRIENMYNLYRQSGATSSTRMSQFRDSTQSNMKDIYGTKKSETLGIHEKWKPLKRLLDIMTYIPEISEQSTRFRVFERNYDMYKSKGNSEMDARILAALESRDATQDFGRTGNLTREINQLIPFSAARVGSSYTFAEKVKANPKRTAMRIAILSAIALAIKAIGYDDKEIEELIQRKKDDNFVMRVGDKIVTIKKPQGLLRSIVNLTEYIEDLATGHIEEGKEGERLGEWLNNAIMDNMPADEMTGAVPNAITPLIENALNKDFYYNTDIVKSYDLELPDSQQYYEYNSQLAILLGKVFNYSPAKIDNLISGYFAGLGTQVTNIMDYASGKLGITAQKAEMGAESNAVGKRFIVNVNSNSASVDEIYNRKTELTKKKNGGTITSEEETELSNITAAVSNMSKVNKQIKEIKRDLTMSGKEKAEQIKELQRQRTDIARQALGKDLLDDTNSEKIETTSFYPTNSSLSLNKMTLELTPEMKEEYSKLASEFYKKYEKQGLYSQDKLKQIKTKAKDYAKKTLMKKYKSQLVKSK